MHFINLKEIEQLIKLLVNRSEGEILCFCIMAPQELQWKIREKYNERYYLSKARRLLETKEWRIFY